MRRYKSIEVEVNVIEALDQLTDKDLEEYLATRKPRHKVNFDGLIEEAIETLAKNKSDLSPYHCYRLQFLKEVLS